MKRWNTSISTRVQPGDVVGHRHPHRQRPARITKSAALLRERGAWVVFGGIHATLYPEEAVRTRAARMRWSRAMAISPGSKVLDDCAAGTPKRIYEGGRVEADAVQAAPAGICCRRDSYMWASVQTVRGCAKHCSFCSVGAPMARSPASARSTRDRGNRRAAPPRLPLHRPGRR